MLPPHRPTATAVLLSSMAAMLLLALSCSTGRKAETDATPQAGKTRIVKGSAPATSELALLMREMTAFADSTGKRLTGGRDLLPFPEQFKKLMSAAPTPGMVERRTFNPFAQAWLHQLDRLYAAPTTERAEVFNALVQTCAGCHGQMCPGPLVRIKKLGIPEDRE